MFTIQCLVARDSLTRGQHVYVLVNTRRGYQIPVEGTVTAVYQDANDRFKRDTAHVEVPGRSHEYGTLPTGSPERVTMLSSSEPYGSEYYFVDAYLDLVKKLEETQQEVETARAEARALRSVLVANKS